MTEHSQIEIDGISVDEGMSVLLQLVWSRGMVTSESCQGGGITDKTAAAYILFPKVDDAAEFLMHCAHLTEYRYGDNIALTIIHPEKDLSQPPRGKVSWVPELTVALTKAWA